MLLRKATMEGIGNGQVQGVFQSISLDVGILKKKKVRNQG